jgi:Flp pilus assembly protein TadG
MTPIDNPKSLASHKALLSRFAKAKEGNVALMVSAGTLSLIVAGGAGLDISTLVSAKAQLQSAADAAALAGITRSSQAYSDALHMGSSGQITAGEDQASAAFTANARNIHIVSNISPTISVQKSGLQLIANVSATATYTPSFASLFGISSLPLRVNALAKTSMPKYIDFYLSVDVSESMGLASTAAEQARLAGLTGGCAFSCHFNGEPSFGYTRNGGNPGNSPVTFCPTPSTSACIQIRVDAVGYAVTNMLSLANTNQAFNGQYRVGIYPFVRYTDVNYAPLTANLASLNTAATNLVNKLDNGVTAALGSGGTHFENALPTVSSLINTVGDGSSSSSPVPFIFFITDGSQDNQWQWNGGWGGSPPSGPTQCFAGHCGPFANSATTIDQSLCNAVKNRGIKLSILYIPYIPVTNPTSFANSEQYFSNANIPNISPSLQNCASPGFFHTANAPTDIDTALQTMFQQAVESVHLTQ